MSENMWVDEARQIAAQCWCDETTSHITMIPELAESIAMRIAAWMETGAQHARNEEYWQGQYQQAHRQGWEQAKGDSIKSVEAMYFRSEDILCGDTIDQATSAIASMEYKEAEHDR